jgi:DNA repair protein RadC
MSKTIHDIPEADRPREKLLRKGAKALSDQELLAVLLGKGTTKIDVMTLARNVTTVADKKGLGLTVEDLVSLEGMGTIKAMLLVAAIEFARRRIKPEGAKIVTPADLLPHVRHYADRKQEHFLCASINGANEILNIRVVSVGLIDRSPVHPREVFADALSDRASAVIVAHNHPSGGLEPSQSDIDITAQLKAAGTIVGIDLLDHIIFNRTGYFSFLEAGTL